MLTSFQHWGADLLESTYSLEALTPLMHFPLNNFKHYLTLFSKVFSSFPHGTCSLSVSCRYLALDGTYHPLWAAFPSNSTRRTRTVHSGAPGHRRDYHPLWCRHPRRIIRGPLLVNSSTRYNSHMRKPRGDLHAELFPLHSPLLGESLLVSFPPLSYMLKFGGSSYIVQVFSQ